MVELRAGKANGMGMSRADARRPRRTRRPAPAGFSYVEVLVAVVVVGVTVIAMLVGLRTTVISGRIGNERSQLMLWAQEGAETLHRTSYVPCSPDGTAMSSTEADNVRNAYQTTVDAVVPPAGVSGGSLVVAAPEFLSIDPASLTERWDDRECDQSFGVAAIRLTATSPEGTSIDLEVILDD